MSVLRKIIADKIYSAPKKRERKSLFPVLFVLCLLGYTSFGIWIGQQYNIKIWYEDNGAFSILKIEPRGYDQVDYLAISDLNEIL